MSITHAVKNILEYNGTKYEWSSNQSAGQENNLSEAIPDSSTDLEVTWGADVSAMQAFLMVADGALTVETNSGSSADDTFNLVADTPIHWTTGSGITNPFTTDVTTNLFVTNSSGSSVTLTIKMIQDPTP